jgi:hypothetical protein
MRTDIETEVVAKVFNTTKLQSPNKVGRLLDQIKLFISLNSSERPGAQRPLWGKHKLNKLNNPKHLIGL